MYLGNWKGLNRGANVNHNVIKVCCLKVNCEQLEDVYQMHECWMCIIQTKSPRLLTSFSFVLNAVIHQIYPLVNKVAKNKSMLCLFGVVGINGGALVKV